MGDDERAFLSRIVETPLDDVPRLAFADWLDEHAGEGECGGCSFLKPAAALRADCPECNGSRLADNRFAARAEFIRVQCEIARIKRECWNCTQRAKGGQHQNGPCCRQETTPLEARCRELTGPHRQGEYGENFYRWFIAPRGGAPVFTGDWGGAVVRRGFVEEWNPTVAWFRENTVVFRWHPILKVGLHGVDPWEQRTRDWYGCRWVFGRDDPSSLGQIMPQELWDGVCERAVYANGTGAGFHTHSDALKAVSDSAVGFGRSSVGLPSIAEHLRALR